MIDALFVHALVPSQRSEEDAEDKKEALERQGLPQPVSQYLSFVTLQGAAAEGSLAGPAAGSPATAAGGVGGNFRAATAARRQREPAPV